MDDSGIEHLGNTLWMPSLQELRNRAIEFYSWVQNPGDIVYTGPGVPHWALSPVGYIFIVYNCFRMEESISHGTAFF